MIIRTEDIKKMCSSIIKALDNIPGVLINDLLEICTENNYLFINITNREYFVTEKFFIGSDIADFRIVIRAEEFLKLIPQFTTETVALSIKDESLCVEGDGKYYFPIIYDDDKIIELPKIEIENVTEEFDISSNTLQSISNVNAREIAKFKAISAIQKYYYIDNDGAITFTSGACINNFNLGCNIKFLLTDKIVRLFKLFNNDKVHIKFGHDSMDEVIQTKIRFEDSNTILTAIITDDVDKMSQIPVTSIRNRATKTYNYSIEINKDSLIKAINRLSLFNTSDDVKINLIFLNDKLIIENSQKSKEIINYTSNVENLDKYAAKVYLIDLKYALDNSKDMFITMSFGDHETFVISRSHIINIIPECD